MSWDYDTQGTTKTSNDWVEEGYGDLSATGTLALNTRMKTIHSAVFAYTEAPWVNGTLTTSRTISSGAITITDSAGALNSGIEVSYQIRGLM